MISYIYLFLFLLSKNKQVVRIAKFFYIGKCLLISTVIKEQEKYSLLPSKTNKHVVTILTWTFFYFYFWKTLQTDNNNLFLGSKYL